MKRFDHHFAEFERDGVLLQRHISNGLKEFRLGKSCAYRMAKSYIEMATKHRNEWLDLVKSAGESPDEWLNKWFRPMEAMGDDYRELVTAIKRGMTRKEYLAKSASMFLSEKDRDKRTRPTAVPTEPKSDLSFEEQMKQWRSIANAFEVQLRDARSRLNKAEHRLAVLEKSTHKMRKELSRVTA